MSSTLILGGVKSGKSLLAEAMARQTDLAVHYIATASAKDAEMQQRIISHQQRRSAYWQLHEVPLNLASAIQEYCLADHCVLVDCLTLWLANLLMQDHDDLLRQEFDNLVACIQNVKGTLIMVSNETNMGIMPLGALTRRYCDEIGILHQRLAQQCDNVVLTVAGLPHFLKGQLDE